MANSHPILLSHGISRFDFLTHLLNEAGGGAKKGQFQGKWLDGIHYFRNIRTSLEKAGLGPVMHTNVPFAAGVAERSTALGDQVMEIVAKTGCAKVHIIAHSMGGLDARHMIVHHKAGKKIASLTTIGTPHHGTPFADLGHKFGAAKWPGPLRKYTGVDFSGFLDLTTNACKKFNEDPRTRLVEATNKVHYTACYSEQAFAASFALLHLSWGIINMAKAGGGPNDGLVPVSSQKWDRELTAEVTQPGGAVSTVTKLVKQTAFPFPADHLNQIGWWHLGEIMQPKALDSVVKSVRERTAWNPQKEYEQQVQGFYRELAQAAREV